MLVWPQVAAACSGVQFSVSRAFTSAPNSIKTLTIVFIIIPLIRYTFKQYKKVYYCILISLYNIVCKQFPLTNSSKSSIQLWCKAVSPSSSPLNVIYITYIKLYKICITNTFLQILPDLGQHCFLTIAELKCKS